MVLTKFPTFGLAPLEAINEKMRIVCGECGVTLIPLAANGGASFREQPVEKFVGYAGDGGAMYELVCEFCA